MIPGPRGRKEYYTARTRDGITRYYLPPMCYTLHAEGDVTFQTTPRPLHNRLPRKIKKWVRKETGWGAWKPWWTNHATRAGAALQPGALR
ncbi:hypothetical protein [Arthrobacter sp. A2-55]|uniref:hypothetical protein n=1 Tax=Arthrobacter sp. A2-55 TaxID=2897337 RepID=UPI0021CD1E88|nr:hypothetical protein [Arthrobacter sp. A2-55]MCU6480532.1 hypothetical protein [Arthrobacter sp. A2-55]